MRSHRIKKATIIKESMCDSPIRSVPRNTESSLSVCKIHASWFENKESALGTGFFIKIKKERNPNLYQYFLVTCHHVILEKKFETGNEEIDIYYHLERAKLTIQLDKNERFIKQYESSYNVDITIIELKENEVPVQYFMEPDYNIINNYDYYLNKKIIIHQFPYGNEQCFSEGKIFKINKENKEMHYQASTQYGSSGSPVVLEKNGYVIGVHKQFDYEGNCANFFDVVLTDNERKNNVYYRRENNNNIRIINYTSQRVLVKKTIDERVYDKNNCDIILKKTFNGSYDLTVISNHTHSEYYTKINSEEGDDIFDLFDNNCYYFSLYENNDILELNVVDDITYFLEKKGTESIKHKPLNPPFPPRPERSGFKTMEKKPKDVKLEKNLEGNIINEFNNLYLNPYKSSKKIEDYENKKDFKPKTDDYNYNYKKTNTVSYKKDDGCNIW